MALTPADHALTLYRSERFRGWMMVLLGNVARDVYVEPVNAPNHDARIVMARAVILNPASYVDRFVNALIGDVEVAALGGLPEPTWDTTHLLLLREKIVEIWTPLAVGSIPPA